MRIKLLLILSHFFIFFFSFSQQEIKVELKDSETNEPISFATIRFQGTRRGFIADYDGQFRLPYQNLDSIPNLLITSLGYKSVTVVPKELKTSEINVISMIPQIESLETVIIDVSKNKKVDVNTLKTQIKKGKKMLAAEIVDKAIKQIPFNLDSDSHSYIGYYRDYQLLDKEYYNLNESILEQFDAGINTYKVYDSINKEVLYSFKQNKEFNISEKYASQYDGLNKFVQNAQIRGFGGNELSILNVHNPIRNFNTNTFSYIYQLDKDFIPNHSFTKSDIYFVDDVPVIDITFFTEQGQRKGVVQTINKQVPKAIKNKVKGILTIALTDFAIYRFNYSMQDNNNANPLFNVSIEYKKQGTKMYLNYISFNNRFLVAEDFTFETSDIIFNKNDFIFNVTLNSDVDYKSVKKRNFKIRYNGERVLIKSVDVVNPRKIKIKINDYNDSLSEMTEEDIKELNFLIKSMKDSKGREIYKKRTVTAYQFREFFVQEVFPGKTVKNDLKFVSKIKPLYNAPINKLIDTEPYIINSPLEKRRMKVEK